MYQCPSVFRLAVLAYRCQHNTAPRYLTAQLQQASNVGYRQRLRSSSSAKLDVPRTEHVTIGGVKRTSTVTAINYCTVDRQLLIALHRSSILQPDIPSESRFLPTPPAFDTLIAITFRMVWLPEGEKKFENMFIRFHRIAQATQT